jgi:hypothetical protein
LKMYNAALQIRDPDKWARMVVDAFVAKGKTKHLFIADIDDTILNSMERWYSVYTSLASGLNGTSVISQDEFKSLGPRIFIEPLVEDYSTFKELMMSDKKLHTNMRSMPSVGGAIDSLEKYKIPHGYITARPEILGEITMANLLNQGLNSAPMLLRYDIEFSDAIRYKVNALCSLKKHLDKAQLENVTIYYIDDYTDIVDQVNSLENGIVGISIDSNFNWNQFIDEKLLERAAC